jgi:hypothetical protein
MNSEKYIGLRRSSSNHLGGSIGFHWQVSHGIHPGNESATILEFFAGLRGTLSGTFEEGTWAAWLYDLLKPHVAKLVDVLFSCCKA